MPDGVPTELTGVDELLVLGIPAFLSRDLLLDGRDLCYLCEHRDNAAGHAWTVEESARVETAEPTYQISGFDLEGELLLLQIL